MMNVLSNDQSFTRQSDSSYALRLHAYGGPESLRIDRVESPEPGPGQVLVKVTAAGVNALDWKIREGIVRDVFKLQLPATLGIEMAGVVVQIGPGVAGFSPGDRVMGSLGGVGAYANKLAIDARKLAATPPSLSDVEAAALPVASITAWQILRTAEFDLAGRHVLIHGAAGGVGGFAVQFAKAAGATVHATASTSSVPHIRELGADEVIDYCHQEFDSTLRDIDFVVDLVGGETVERSWSVLRRGGVIASTTTPDVVTRAREGHRGIWFVNTQDALRLAMIAAQVAAGAIRSKIAEVVGFDQLSSAIERNRIGHAPGKTVVDFTL